MTHSARLVTVLMVGSRAGACEPTPPAARDALADQKAFVTGFSRLRTAVSPLTDGRILAADLSSPAGTRLTGFERDDPVSLVLTLARLEGRPPEPATLTYPVVAITLADDPTVAKQLTVLDEKVAWTGGGKTIEGTAAAAFLTANLDLRQVMAELPDGRYRIACEWPAEAGPTALASFDVTVGQVTVEQARAAAVLTAELDPKVRLVLAPQSDQSHRTRATLVNNTGRRIAFVGYVEQLPSGVDADGRVWSAMNRTDVYKPGGWSDAGLGGFCGNGLGRISVKPGQTAQLEVFLPDRDDIYRVRVPWYYADRTATSIADGAAVSDIVALSPQQKNAQSGSSTVLLSQ